MLGCRGISVVRSRFRQQQAVAGSITASRISVACNGPADLVSSTRRRGCCRYLSCHVLVIRRQTQPRARFIREEHQMDKRRLIQLACLQFALTVLSNAAISSDGGPFLQGRNVFVIAPDGARYELGDASMQVPQGSRVVSLEGGEAVVEYGNGGATYRLGGNEILTLTDEAKRGAASTTKPSEHGGGPPTSGPSKQPPGYSRVGYTPPGHRPPDHHSPDHRPPGHRPPDHWPPGHRPPGHHPPHCPPISP